MSSAAFTGGFPAGLPVGFGLCFVFGFVARLLALAAGFWVNGGVFLVMELFCRNLLEVAMKRYKRCQI